MLIRFCVNSFFGNKPSECMRAESLNDQQSAGLQSAWSIQGGQPPMMLAPRMGASHPSMGASHPWSGSVLDGQPQPPDDPVGTGVLGWGPLLASSTALAPEEKRSYCTIYFYFLFLYIVLYYTFLFFILYTTWPQTTRVATPHRLAEMLYQQAHAEATQQNPKCLRDEPSNCHTPCILIMGASHPIITN